MKRLFIDVLGAFMICGCFIAVSIGVALVYVHFGTNPELSLLLGVSRTGMFISLFAFIPIAFKVMSDGDLTLRKALGLIAPALGLFIGLLLLNHFAPSFFSWLVALNLKAI